MKKLSPNGPGVLVAIEGATGSGKSFFCSRLERIIEGLVGRAPTRMGGFKRLPPGRRIPLLTRVVRRYLRTSRFIGLPWLSETTLLLSEQALNVDTVVKPRLLAGDVVLYENYNDALIAYQLMRGQSLDIPLHTLMTILRRLVDLQSDPFGYPSPDLTVYLHSPESVYLRRLKRRDRRPVTPIDRIRIRQVRQNYNTLYAHSKSVLRIDNGEGKDLGKDLQRIASEVERTVKAYE